MRKFTVHILGLPHTRITHEYSHCAFTQKAKNLSRMLHSLGHTVYLYGAGEDNHDFCTEYIPIVNDKQFNEWFPDRKFLDWNNPERWAFFNEGCVREIKKRANKGDIVASTFGNLQLPACQGIDCIPVETGIGYTGVFAPFQVYESYALRNYIYGVQNAVATPRHHDTVIPNYYDTSDFGFSEKPEEYFFFIGRLNPDKGYVTACRVAKLLGIKIKLAGVIGEESLFNEVMSYGNVEYVGVVNTIERKVLMENALATFVPSLYIEPFGGVHVESMLSGVPVLTTDVGVFPETVQNGFNGYRCNNLAEFIEAAKCVGSLNKKAIKDWATKNFSMETIGPRYEYYFSRIYDLFEGKGYETIDVKAKTNMLNTYLSR